VAVSDLQACGGAFREIFTRAGVALLLAGDDGRVLEVNEALAMLIGTSGRELRGTPFADLCVPARRHVARTGWTNLVKEGSLRCELELACRWGRIARVEVRALANVAPGTHCVGFWDVTRRREREEHSERYQILARHTHDIVLFVRRDGQVLEANDAALRAYGYTRDEMLTLTIGDLRDPSTRLGVAEQLERAFSSGVRFETVHKKKDGTTFPVEVGSRSAVVGGERVILSIIRDVTDRHQLQSRLVQTDRLSAMGTLAAGVAHEINNPLAYALANLDLAARRIKKRSALARDAEGQADVVEDLEQLERMLEIAREGMDRVRTIVKDLRTFARGDDDRLVPVDVRRVLESSINIALGEIRHRARLVRDYREVPVLLANESRLGQVFLNLLVNAAQAVPADRGVQGEVRVATWTDGEGRAVVEVADDGVGMSADLVARLFEPFVTTKPPGQGTGLGLYISRSIVHDAGGEIEVETSPGHGTKMRVVLPARAVPTPPPSATFEPLPDPAPARILVVDDEPHILEMLRAQLGERHQVVVALGGLEADDILQRDVEFDAVLCDVMMPDRSGIELYRSIEYLQPELAARFVFMTGGAFTPDSREFIESRPKQRLEKPFTSEELEAALRRTLARRRATP